MIQFFRGPGNRRQRFFGEFVPFLVALFSWGVLQAFFGPLLALLAALVAWLLTSLLVVWLRATPLRKRLYHFALFGHVVFWSFLGAGEAPLAGPTSLNEAGRTRQAEFRRFRVGFGEAAFELARGDPLGGWGGRDKREAFPPLAGLGPVGRFGQGLMAGPAGAPPRRRLFATGEVGEPRLGARAIWLEANGGAPLLLIRLDVVAVDRHVVEAVHEDLRDLGVRAENLLVAATHTHTGPGGHLRAPLAALVGADHYESRMAEVLRRAATAAARAAQARAAPAGLALGRGRDRDASGAPLLARNRRLAENEIDDRVLELRAYDAGHRPLGSLAFYAVHPTLFRARHRVFERDLVGAVEEARGATLQGPCLFFNGAQGDIAPARLPLEARERAHALAERFQPALGDPVVRPDQIARKLRMTSVRFALGPGDACAVVGVGDRTQLHEALAPGVFGSTPGDAVAALLALPVNALLWSMTLTDVRVGFTFDGQVGAVASLRHATDPAPVHLGAVGLEFEMDDGSIEKLLLLWQPFEAIQAVGRGWRRLAAERGWSDTALVGLCNDARAYLVDPATYARGGYEAQASLYGPHLGADVDRAFRRALDRLAGK